MPRPFKTITTECALYLAEGSVFRFTTTADLVETEDMDGVGLKIGEAVAKALGTMGRKIGEDEIRGLRADLAKARGTIETLTKKYEDLRDARDSTEPPPPAKTTAMRAGPAPKDKRSAKRG